MCVCVKGESGKRGGGRLVGTLLFKGLKGHLPKTNNLFQLRGSEKSQCEPICPPKYFNFTHF